jgi:hypothetical protein
VSPLPISFPSLHLSDKSPAPSACVQRASGFWTPPWTRQPSTVDSKALERPRKTKDNMRERTVKCWRERRKRTRRRHEDGLPCTPASHHNPWWKMPVTCHLTCRYASGLIAMHVSESTRSLHSYCDLEHDSSRRAALEAHFSTSAANSAKCKVDCTSDHKHSYMQATTGCRVFKTLSTVCNI